MASDGMASPRALARTYDPRSYDDAWEQVRDYRDVLDHHERHPDDSSYAIAGKLDLPQGRVAPWLEGSRPNAVRGIDTARVRDWLDPDPDGPTYRALNVLVAWVFSAGSINTLYVPYFVVDEDGTDRGRLARAAELAGIDLDFTRRNEPGRATELRPVEDASVLGRVLAAAGTPVGAKDEGVSLPGYLRDAPTRIRREFVGTYVTNRGTRIPATGETRIPEPGPEAYRHELAAFAEDVTGEAVSVEGDDVVLSAAATRVVDGWPPVLGETRAP